MQLFMFLKVKHAQTAVVISLMHSVKEIEQIIVNVRYLFNRNGWTMHGGYDDVMLWLITADIEYSRPDLGLEDSRKWTRTLVLLSALIERILIDLILTCMKFSGKERLLEAVPRYECSSSEIDAQDNPTYVWGIYTSEGVLFVFCYWSCARMVFRATELSRMVGFGVVTYRCRCKRLVTATCGIHTVLTVRLR